MKTSKLRKIVAQGTRKAHKEALKLNIPVYIQENDALVEIVGGSRKIIKYTRPHKTLAKSKFKL